MAGPPATLPRSRTMPRCTYLALFPLAFFAPGGGTASDPVDGLVKAYTWGVREVNEKHAQKPGKTRERDLAKRLSKPSRGALETLLRMKDSPALLDGLVACGEAALDLDLVEDFERVRGRLAAASPEHSRKLGAAVSRPRFVLRGLGGLDAAFLQRFADVVDAVLDAYGDVFAFEEWSKVPGKKLRVKVHFQREVEKRSSLSPHFAPELPFHSEIDFPVADASAFKSPTPDGRFLFYGLCHELGHVIAMWGDGTLEEDHHAWAHYTGVAIVEHLSEKGKDLPALRNLADVRWRSLSLERKRLKGQEPSLADREGVLTLLIALHDTIGAKRIGAAINHLDRQDRRRRIQHVRYYTFMELKESILETLKSPEEKRQAAEAFPEAAKK